MVIQMNVTSHRSAFLNSFIKKAQVVFGSDCDYLKVVSLPTKSKVFTVLKSPHVNKKAREQFCFETHKKLIVLDNVNPSILKNFLDKVSCKGVALKITLKGG